MSEEVISETSNSPDLTAESKESPETADSQEKQQQQEEKTKDNKAALVDDATDSHQPSDLTSENKENLLESEEPKSKVMLWHCNSCISTYRLCKPVAS